jgi:serine/threonine protein kinase
LEQLLSKDNDPEKFLEAHPMPIQLLNIYQLATGLEYIHKQGLIHRDLKPENVLIKETLMKWADFGLSKQVNERGTCSMSGIKGTREWLAPELLKLLVIEEEITQRGTIKSDVFSEGLVFGYYLSNGLHPFGSRDKIYSNILENKPINLDSKYYLVYHINHAEISLKFMFRLTGTECQLCAFDIIKRMLEGKPEDRINSSDVVELLSEKVKTLVLKKVINKK